MAKTMTTSKPAGAAPPATDEGALPTQAARDTIAARSVAIDIPLVAPQGRIPRHVNMQLSREEGETLRRLLDALQLRGARLANGRFAQSSADAVRWLLQAIHATGK